MRNLSCKAYLSLVLFVPTGVVSFCSTLKLKCQLFLSFNINVDGSNVMHSQATFQAGYAYLELPAYFRDLLYVFFFMHVIMNCKHLLTLIVG